MKKFIKDNLLNLIISLLVLALIYISLRILMPSILVNFWQEFILVLNIIDSYLKLIIISWPGVILILGIFLLFRHSTALDRLIGRITELPGGVKTPIITEQDEKSEKKIDELKQKTLTAVEESSTPRPLISGTDAAKDQFVKDLIADNQKLKKDYAEEAKKRLFERIHGNIFGSQIQILMGSKGPAFTVKEALKIYIDAITKNPGLNNYKFIDYMTFLKNTNLIAFDDLSNHENLVRITPQGAEFLEYILREGLNINKSL